MMVRAFAVWLIRLSIRVDPAALFIVCKYAMEDPAFLETAAKYEVVTPTQEPTP